MSKRFDFTDEEVSAFIEGYQDNFVEKRPMYQQRIDNPELFPAIDNGDGSVSTHRMATTEQDGKAIAFPMIQYDPTSEELVEYPSKEWRSAFASAKQAGNYKEFDNPKEAELYARNYKKLPNAERFRDHHKDINTVLNSLLGWRDSQ